MELASIWRLLHLFFSFGFVGTLVVAEWNGRAARATEDWGQRAALFRVVHLSSRVAGFGGLVLLGVFGHLNAVALGYRMMASPWLQWVTGVWLAAIAVMVLVVLPAVARLAAAAEAAAGGGAAAGYEAALRRWRVGNVAMSLLYLSLLALMVFRWR
jgi:hypothetical protein